MTVYDLLSENGRLRARIAETDRHHAISLQAHILKHIADAFDHDPDLVREIRKVIINATEDHLENKE
jgi:hypothetical protein